jgi:hypothetical protein
LGEKVFRGFDSRGEALYRAVAKRFGPGSELPASEVERLQGLGFLEDPSKLVTDEAQAAKLLGAKVMAMSRDQPPDAA